LQGILGFWGSKRHVPKFMDLQCKNRKLAIMISTNCQRLFCISSKTSNGSDLQETFDQIATTVQTLIRVPALSFDRDPSYDFRHNKPVVPCIESYREHWRNLDELLNLKSSLNMEFEHDEEWQCAVRCENIEPMPYSIQLLFRRAVHVMATRLFDRRPDQLYIQKNGHSRLAKLPL
jgi:hypothetical protein